MDVASDLHTAAGQLRDAIASKQAAGDPAIAEQQQFAGVYRRT